MAQVRSFASQDALANQLNQTGMKQLTSMGVDTSGDPVPPGDPNRPPFYLCGRGTLACEFGTAGDLKKLYRR